MHQARTVLLMDFLVLSAASCPSSEMLQLSWSVSPPPRGCSNGPDSFMPHICTIRAPERWARGPVATKPLPLTGNISTTLLPTSQKSSTMFSQIWLACFSQLYYPQKLKQLLFALGGGLSEFSVRCHGLIFLRMCVNAQTPDIQHTTVQIFTSIQVTIDICSQGDLSKCMGGNSNCEKEED